MAYLGFRKMTLSSSENEGLKTQKQSLVICVYNCHAQAVISLAEAMGPNKLYVTGLAGIPRCCWSGYKIMT